LLAASFPGGFVSGANVPEWSIALKCVAKQFSKKTRIFRFNDLPEPGDEALQFRLIYEGPLPSDKSNKATSNRQRMVTAKQCIRSAFHPQIKHVWMSHAAKTHEVSSYHSMYTEDNLSFWEFYANKHKVVSEHNHIHRFCPLINDINYHGCSIDILFLRHDVPGELFEYGGDLDNRLKVLMDALRKPRDTQEVDDNPQLPTENPCFCLLSDDKYIDQLSITTDRLPTPLKDEDKLHDVLLIITVRATLVDLETDRVMHW
jgi:hypothetical protein